MCVFLYGSSLWSGLILSQSLSLCESAATEFSGLNADLRSEHHVLLNTGCCCVKQTAIRWKSFFCLRFLVNLPSLLSFIRYFAYRDNTLLSLSVQNVFLLTTHFFPTTTMVHYGNSVNQEFHFLQLNQFLVANVSNFSNRSNLMV